MMNKSFERLLTLYQYLQVSIHVFLHSESPMVNILKYEDGESWYDTKCLTYNIPLTLTTLNIRFSVAFKLVLYVD